MQSKRFTTVKSSPGVRYDSWTQSYCAQKYICGKRYTKTFATLKEARSWKNEFHPLLATLASAPTATVPQGDDNGSLGHTLGEVWQMYREAVFPTLEAASIENKIKTLRFIDRLLNVPMKRLIPDVIDAHIKEEKAAAIVCGSALRCNFDHDLKELKTLLNWYRENYDFKFVVPILKRHNALGFIKPLPKRNRKITAEETAMFFEALGPFFRDFAMTQFFVAGRVSEVAGIQEQDVDLDNRCLTIQHVLSWQLNKRVCHLKSTPKNGEARFCYLNESLFDILSRRLKTKPKNCTYVFEENGAPLKYRQIEHAYNSALKRCGLFGKYSGTHILRHGMATTTRRVTGSLESTQAVTGHKDQRLVQHYATMHSTKQRDAVIEVEKFMRELQTQN